MGYLCANFSLPRLLCLSRTSGLTREQTDRRQIKESLNASSLWGRGIIILAAKLRSAVGTSDSAGGSAMGRGHCSCNAAPHSGPLPILYPPIMLSHCVCFLSHDCKRVGLPVCNITVHRVPTVTRAPNATENSWRPCLQCCRASFMKQPASRRCRFTVAGNFQGGGLKTFLFEQSFDH